MNSSEACSIYARLNDCYDLQASSGEFLHFNNPYQILIATILSAQTTDRVVNQVTEILFSRYPSPFDLADADIRDIEDIIHSTGFFHAKAKNIISAARMVVTDYQGIVPDTIDLLQTLPGVGRKTANIVVHHGFGRADGIAVDTHVKRLSVRLGLSDQSDPEKIEQDLLRIFPKKIWGDLNGLFILHGRKTCTARNPACNRCVLCDLCRFAQNHSH